MGQLKNVLRCSKDWDDQLIQEGLTNVVSYLKKKDFKSVELRLLVPYYTENLRLLGRGEIDPFVLKKFTEEHQRFYDDVEVKAPEVILGFVKLFKGLMENDVSSIGSLKQPVSFNAFVTEERKIYLDDWAGSVNVMFRDMKTEIFNKSERKVHVVYLLDSSLFKGINVSNNISFFNYVMF